MHNKRVGYLHAASKKKKKDEPNFFFFFVSQLLFNHISTSLSTLAPVLR
jgi:hypothetical protein